MIHLKTIVVVVLLAVPLLAGACRKSDSRAVAAQADKPVAAQTESVTVHITRTGKKYHRAGCSSLSKSDTPIDLEKAKARGYTACSRCNP